MNKELGVEVALSSLFMALTLIVNPTTVFAVSATNSQSPYIKLKPRYAKWGKLAVSETQKRYPRASVVDYLHVRRQMVSPSTTQEVFKLWLKDDQHEFGVYIRIVFNTKTEQILKVRFQKTTH